MHVMALLVVSRPGLASWRLVEIIVRYFFVSLSELASVSFSARCRQKTIGVDIKSRLQVEKAMPRVEES